MLQQNEKAIALYQKVVFSICREFVVLRVDDFCPTSSASQTVEFTNYEPFPFQREAGGYYPLPSYEHSDDVIRHNPELYGVAFVKREVAPAYCVYAKADRRIIQMGCQNIEDLEAILRNLLMRYGSVTVKNIDAGNGRFWNCSAGSASKRWQDNSKWKSGSFHKKSKPPAEPVA